VSIYQTERENNQSMNKEGRPKASPKRRVEMECQKFMDKIDRKIIISKCHLRIISTIRAFYKESTTRFPKILETKI
jgi:hypothetical protein